MSLGDHRKDIYETDVDRHDFLKTLAETCEKTGFEIHAYCLMRNHFHLVVETPNANLVEGMCWLLSTYTIRLNRRNRLFGHVFSGRHNAIVVEGSGTGYLRMAYDYVHLNPAGEIAGPPGAVAGISLEQPGLVSGRAGASAPLDARGPAEHGIQKDHAAGRERFERQMERRRAEESDAAEWKSLERGWCLGSEPFRAKLLERLESQLGQHHSGRLRFDTAAAKAERIVAEELKRLGWKEGEPARRPKGDGDKLAIAARLRPETTLTVAQLAQRLRCGTWKSLRNDLYLRGKVEGRMKAGDKGTVGTV